jgi:8-oxo-dGTP pyrophosphatase MutT (NUDIX family)
MTPFVAALKPLLAAHVPADPAEAAHQAALLALCGAPGDPCRRTHWAPGHFTASAFVLSPDRADLLLVWHTKLQRWLQPGGHIEPADADVFAAARREVAEEAGVADLELLGAGVFDLDVHAVPARGAEPAHQHFDVRPLFRALDDGLTHGSDAGGARWVPLGAIGPAATDESVLRALRKIRALRRRGEV